MIDPRTEELLHRELDGQATAEQLSELQARLAQSPEGQAFREDLREMHQALDSTREVEPPAGLRQEILARVAAAQPSWSLDETRGRAARNQQTAMRGRSVWQRFLDALRNGLRPREAFAFGLGAAACLVIVFVAGWDRFESIRFPDNALPGSMIPLEETGSFESIDHQMLDVDGTRLFADLSRRGGLLQLTVQIDSPAAMVLEAHFDPETLAARGFGQSAGTPGLAASMVDGGVRIQHTGSATYSIRFEERRPSASTIQIQIHNQGQPEEILLRTGE